MVDRMIGDRENSPRQIVLLRPKAQKGFRRRAAKFPGQCVEGRHPRAVFANLDGFRSSESAQTSIQVGGEFHAF
jgi:hypothetical protein